MYKRTKIVCTMGPACDSDETIREMIKAGMNVARFNFSHGSYDEHHGRIERVRRISKELGMPVGILLDTKGPEVRTGLLVDGKKVAVKTGDKIVVTAQPTSEDFHGTAEHISLDYLALPSEVEKGSLILIDDGLVALEVESVDGQDMTCVVKNDGLIGERKGVNMPNVNISLPAITERDRQDILFGLTENIDYIAASFIRDGESVRGIRELCRENGGEHVTIFPKIECALGVENFDEILEASDGIMVARGDLGVEVPAEEVPMLQKVLIRKCHEAGEPVITATQMLESMCNNPRPTRAETSDVANAIIDGTDAIMLSGETAGGLYPVEAVETMARVATFTESNFTSRPFEDDDCESATTTESIGKAVVKIAKDLHAAAIIASTERGGTAQMISKFRPDCPIVAVSPHEAIVRRLQLNWGVQAINGKEAVDSDAVVDNAIFAALDNDLIKAGDLVVLTAGVPVAKAGSTNMIRVQVVGDVLLRGTGIGRNSAIGKVCVAESLEDLKKNFTDGCILVLRAARADFVEYMKRASAIVSEEAGLTSESAIVAITLGIPTVVGAEHAADTLNNGEVVTVDASRGTIFRGAANAR